MATGNDFRLALSRETTYGTRVAPSRFIPLSGESIEFARNRAFSSALGMGRWQRPSVLTSRAGSGSLNGDVPTTGFGFLLDALHGNTVTPTQQASTTAYLQTHTLDTPPSKSYSIQKQIPPVLTGTLLPMDYTGCVFGALTLSWTAAGLLTYEIQAIVQEETTGLTLVTYVAPTGWIPFGFQGGSVSIGGTPELNIIGNGSVTIGASLRDDAFVLGGAGTMAKPVETEKPTAVASFTADFNDLTNVTRVVNNTNSDLVIKFEGPTIASTYKYAITVTLPDCVFTTASPTVNDPGPVGQTISMNAASTTGDAPSVLYMSTDVTI